MRIGLVLDDTLDTPDGVQQYVLTVGAWLSAHGHEVYYFVGHTARTDLANVYSLSRNVSVRFNGNRMSMPLPARSSELKRFIDDNKLDVVHVQVPYSPFLAGKILRRHLPETAFVGTFHILPYTRLVRLANRALAIWNRRSGRRFNTMLAVSDPAKQFAEATYGYRGIKVIPNPVRLEAFTGTQSTDPQLNIVFLGRLVERKGAQHLLAAITELRRQQLFTGDFRVHIGGKGELLLKLQAYVTENKLSDVVSFDGFIAESDKAAYLAQADIAIFPSTSGESFGIILLEAMAAARGVVLGGDNPGYASVLAGLENRLFDPVKTANLAVVLAKWLADASSRTTAAQQQKAYVPQFDIEQVGPRIVEVYEQALREQRTV